MDWSNHPEVEIDPEIVHGAPVYRGTRLPVETTIGSYYAYMELQGLTDNQAVQATLEDFPTIPCGALGLRSILAYEAAHQAQFVP